MDTSWWLALGAVVALALVAALIDGHARLGRQRRREPPRRREPRPPGPLPEPRPGEVWWAQLPSADGTGVKERPCLVLSLHREDVRVARITSSHPAEGAAAVIPLPAAVVGDAQGRPGFLETGELRDVPLWDLRRRTGAVDAELWARVRHLAR